MVMCRFSRLNNIINTGQDLNLNGSYFLFFARRVDGMMDADTQLQATFVQCTISHLVQLNQAITEF